MPVYIPQAKAWGFDGRVLKIVKQHAPKRRLRGGTNPLISVVFSIKK